ncbi:MAG: sigma-70 family RNA polymerase sigma factor [Oscillospiraceae bacterium]|nr:sigma-70 family RNA polymerase sigma factor [Oscillospiraceae bacterium]
MDFINAKEIENMDNDISGINIDNNFYEKYTPQIRAIVTKILNNAGQSRDIDDCVSTVYLELIEKLQQYNEIRGSLAAFITVIARSVALNYCRDNNRKIYELIGDDKINFLSKPLRFENEVEFDILVKSLFEKLNEKECALFTMRFILFDSPEEIAEVFKVSRNTVDKRVSRLKIKVKKILIKGGIIL